MCMHTFFPKNQRRRLGALLFLFVVFLQGCAEVAGIGEFRIGEPTPAYQKMSIRKQARLSPF